jgi:hypothetical protein
MGKRTQDIEEAAKKNKVVTMPQKDGGKGVEETEKGEKKSRAKHTLRHAVKDVVESGGDELAGKLMDEVRQGNLHSAEVLLALAAKMKKKKGGEGGNPDEPSLAEQMTEGPTWEDVVEARRKAKEEEEEEGGEEEADRQLFATSF